VLYVYICNKIFDMTVSIIKSYSIAGDVILQILQKFLNIPKNKLIMVLRKMLLNSINPFRICILLVSNLSCYESYSNYRRKKNHVKKTTTKSRTISNGDDISWKYYHAHDYEHIFLVDDDFSFNLLFIYWSITLNSRLNLVIGVYTLHKFWN